MSAPEHCECQYCEEIREENAQLKELVREAGSITERARFDVVLVSEAAAWLTKAKELLNEGEK